MAAAPRSAPVPLPLEERLVQVALALLEEQGVEALTLRRVARRAGVSHGAPLRHFPGLAALRAEIAARGFRRLEAAVAAAAARLPAGAGARPRLAAAGRAYVETAVAAPALFALMFRPDALDTARPSFREASSAAFGQLLRHVRAAQDEGWQPTRDTTALAGAVWAAVHGLATLWSQGALAVPLAGASLEIVLHTTLELTLGAPLEGPPAPRPEGEDR